MATENPMRIMSSGNGMRGGIPLSESMRNSSGNGITSSGQEGVAQEIGMLLRNHSRMDTMFKWKDMVPNRSGSAPPSMEGSLASIGSFLPSSAASGGQVANSGSAEGASVIDSEQELRSDPAYLAYYYSHVNLNPRLPPPIISRKNYFLAQQLASSGFADKRKLSSFDDSNNRSLFSTQPVLPTHDEETEANEEDEESPFGNLLRQASNNWGPDALSGSALGAFGARHKSLVDLIQQDFPRTPSPVYSQTRSGRTVNDEALDGGASGLENSAADLNIPLLNTSNPMPTIPVSTRSKTPTPTMNSILPSHNTTNVNAPSGSLPGGLGPITRIPTPDPIISGESFVDEISSLRTSAMRGSSMGDGSGVTEAAKLTAALQGLSFSSKHPVAPGEAQDSSVVTLDSTQMKEAQEDSQMKILEKSGHKSQNTQVQSQNTQYGAYPKTFQRQQPVTGLEHGYKTQEKQGLPSHSLNSSSAYTNFANLQVPNNVYTSQYGVGAYSINHNINPRMMSNYTSPVAYDGAAAAAAAAALASGMGTRSSPPGLDMHHLYKNTGIPHSQLTDPLLLHYLQQRSLEEAQASLGSTDSSLLRGYLGDPLELQKNKSMYTADYLSQLSRSGSLGGKLGNKTGAVSPGYYGSPPGGFVMPYGNSTLQGAVLPDSPIIPGALSLRHGNRGSSAVVYGGWQGQRASDTSEDFKGSSLLEELKNSKTRRFELIDIAGHVVEFSVDQHGSRFIQQKLEVACSEEKALVFDEVLPRALTLMTDVFGNYVIQKFFEHGSPEQRSELASQLIGHVLELSLQMYGCRVIQKALEVVSLDQQIRIVSELEGHVMRCVRDQNGNHVIQKCIECVPTENIQFIISACYGQVVMLSTHPYGCRVIQRVLEHCTDEQKQSGIVEDILRSTCELALDQYGNYVVQHVLEHGKPHEKSEIMKKLAGQIVQMSQHKFASNVVEKCLEYGGPNERQILISEMLGHTDENEPLQAMMKDQYANYVVQKVLETCDDQQRELLLSRIRVHLHALKKYTYGKHIVARVEKLLAAGERRGAQTAA